MDRLDAVAALLGRVPGGRKPASAVASVATATATSDSSGGRVRVDFGGASVTGDGMQSVEVPTTVDVRAGDVVRVELVGADGAGKSPTVTGVVGGGDRTRRAVDEAASDASAARSTAGEAKSAADAAGATAADAQAKAAALSTLIRQTDAGVEVGKSSDGKTYTTNRALMSSAGAFQVLDKGGTVLANFDADSVDLGGESSSVNLLGGKGVIETTSTPINGESQATLGLQSDFIQVVASGDSTGYATLGARNESTGKYTQLSMSPRGVSLRADVNELSTTGLMVNAHEAFLCEMLHFKRVVTASDYLVVHGFVLGSTIVDVVGLAVVAVYWGHGRFHANAWGSTTLATFNGWWCDDDFNFPAEPDASSMVLQGIHDAIVFRSTRDQDVDGWVSGCLCFPVHRR